MRRHTLALVVLIALAGCSDVSFVERITVVNDGDFPAHVEVTDRARSGWLGLGVAQNHAETSFDQVIDQGETWVFRFDYIGKHHEDLEVSRSELERSSWTVEVPAEFAATLLDLGVSPPPP